jgi:mannose-6-phosphate isomerase-like protein (cupin superfamily)
MKDKRPWGHFEVLHREKGIQIKRLELKPGLQFSLQKHERRSERWIILSGEGLVSVGDKKKSVKKGDFIEIPCSASHRLKNTHSFESLVVLEAQFGEYLGEDDVIRLEDDFGRT